MIDSMTPIFPELPSKLGLYTVTEKLSTRQYSELYNAYQSYVDRGVVLEALRPGSQETVERYFCATAQARAAVNLPRVSPVLESAQSGSIVYLVQEQPAGVPLSRLVLEQRTTVKMGLRLVEALAELYEAGREQNVAVAPLTADAIYMDGEQINFLSTVSPGSYSLALQTTQMHALADLLEQIIPPVLLKKSSLLSVTNWLRQGYNGHSLEWSSLKSALRTLRARQHSTNKSSENENERPSIRTVLRRRIRGLRKSVVMVVTCVLLVFFVGVIGSRLIPEDAFSSADPAVVGDRVYAEDGQQVYAIRRSPVTIAEYSRFLENWEKMSPEERKKLSDGLVENATEFSPRLPLNWENQLRLAREGDGMTADSPVMGVGYREAMLYARCAGEMLATADQVFTAREHSPGAKEVEEWTSSFSIPQMPYDGCIIVCPARGESVIYASSDEEQVPQRGFRITAVGNAS